MGGSRYITPLILNFGIGGRYVVSFMHQLLYAQVNTQQCPLNRSLLGLQSQSEWIWRREKSPANAGI
jgi:hypothetical protein